MSDKPAEKPPPPRKNFQELICDAIIAGDLEAFKHCCPSKNDVNRRLLVGRKLNPVPKYHPSERYPNIRGPTMVMLAILCEQDEILQYILDTKQPDLSVRVEGQTALHIAAMTKDWRCLSILLKYPYIQENIDQPVEIPGITATPGDKTTALHIAVNNRRLANVFLLVSDLPPLARSADDKEGNEEAQDAATYSPANVLIRTDFGSPPLYLAVFNKDPKIVRVLLAAGADATQKHAKGKTVLELAKELKEMKDREKAASGAAPKRKRSKDPEDEILDLLEGQKTFTLDALKGELCPELVPEGDGIEAPWDEEEDEDEEEEVDDDATPVKKPEVKVRADKKRKKKGPGLSQIYDLLQMMSRRLEALEATQFANVAPFVGESRTRIKSCCTCGGTPANECRECHKCYCDRCFPKPEVHPCH